MGEKKKAKGLGHERVSTTSHHQMLRTIPSQEEKK